MYTLQRRLRWQPRQALATALGRWADGWRIQWPRHNIELEAEDGRAPAVDIDNGLARVPSQLRAAQTRHLKLSRAVCVIPHERVVQPIRLEGVSRKVEEDRNHGPDPQLLWTLLASR